MGHWSADYIGKPYLRGEADCARLLVQVSREVFGAAVPAETEMARAASRLGRKAQLRDGLEAWMDRVETPREGDAVLMYCRAVDSHIGVFCVVDGERCVLHATEKLGMVVRHRLRDLPMALLSVEGFYRWK